MKRKIKYLIQQCKYRVKTTIIISIKLNSFNLVMMIILNFPIIIKTKKIIMKTNKIIIKTNKINLINPLIKIIHPPINIIHPCTFNKIILINFPIITKANISSILITTKIKNLYLSVKIKTNYIHQINTKIPIINNKTLNLKSNINNYSTNNH